MYTITILTPQELHNLLATSTVATGVIPVIDGQWIEVHYTNYGIHHARFISSDDAIRMPRAPSLNALAIAGTPFQLNVWQATLRINKGAPITYGALARMIGAPRAARAVGTALGKNPIAYLIPCHRVIHSDGTSGSYAWGDGRKKGLLDAEQRDEK